MLGCPAGDNAAPRLHTAPGAGGRAKVNLFHAAFSCQMSQSAGLTQPLFCLAASASFRFVFVQYLTPLTALELKPASAAEKATSLPVLPGQEVSWPLALLGSNVFVSVYLFLAA